MSVATAIGDLWGLLLLLRFGVGVHLDGSGVYITNVIHYCMYTNERPPLLVPACLGTGSRCCWRTSMPVARTSQRSGRPAARHHEASRTYT